MKSGQYYADESLFDGLREMDVTYRDSDGPYAVLGLTRRASWDEIRSARRILLSRNHPDRFVGGDADLMAQAERRVRDINEAFAEIRRERAVKGR